ncbi:MAG: YraN family protein [Spirochaetes bacterium]|nr:YraN family protein [Spirochaetota bacterium]
MSYNSKSFGDSGEETAAGYLVENGFRILATKFRYGRYSEIDIISVKENLIVFFEVKTRQNSRFGGSVYSINKRKIHNLKKCAGYFLLKNPDLFHNYIFRFDLICIQNGKIEIIENIIPW